MAFTFTPETEAFPLFDTHAHYYDDRFATEADGGSDAVLGALLAGNVRHIVNAGTNPITNQRVIALAEAYEPLYAVVGIHPEDIASLGDPDEILGELERQLSHPKVVALGEIGLDYHFTEIESEREEQKVWFRRQLALAEKLGVKVVVHDRDAHGDCMDILAEFPKVTGVFHSFSGSGEMARQLVNKGWYISFSGVITFKNATRLAEIVPTVPLDRVFIETDAPYLAPTPYRGQMNHSGLMERTAVRAAELYGIPLDVFCRQTYENALTFFGISE